MCISGRDTRRSGYGVLVGKKGVCETVHQGPRVRHPFLQDNLNSNACNLRVPQVSLEEVEGCLKAHVRVACSMNTSNATPSK